MEKEPQPKKTLLGKRKQPEAETDERDSEIYSFKEGLRFVKPYKHEFTCHVKRRWIGHLLIDIYSKEFKAFSEKYYKDAIEQWKEGVECKGKITVNGKNVDSKYVLRDGDYIVHQTTREETPVCDIVPSIIRETKDYVIVNKPSSIPVHACGNFKFNTL